MDTCSLVKTLSIEDLIQHKQETSALSSTATNEIANRRFVCEPCKKEFKFLSQYKIHIKGKHHEYTLNPPDWKCQKCNRKFEYKSNYERHMNSHKNEQFKHCLPQVSV